MEEIINFLIKARTNTYASGGGKVEPLLHGSTQLEFSDGEYLYRDVYYTGEHTFLGIETIYHQGKVVWSMVYHGDWGTMTEEEIDSVLRPALIENAKTARTSEQVDWQKDNFQYKCTGAGDELNFQGTETITSEGKELYKLTYNSTKIWPKHYQGIGKTFCPKGVVFLCVILSPNCLI
ncbi:MAG: DUF5680 domain-containing protein [Patescibacteria group bacterium]|nr:DUF5680 domain-containing protein [Patescibacteria group bacterium]